MHVQVLIIKFLKYIVARAFDKSVTKIPYLILTTLKCKSHPHFADEEAGFKSSHRMPNGIQQ